MRLLAAATALCVALLAGATTAPAADVGANDDSAKHAADAGAAMYREMAAVGLRQTIIGVRFKPSEAVVIQDKQLLDRVIPNVLDAGLRVVLAVYPYPPRQMEAGLGSPGTFAGYVAALARMYPGVREFVIGNEPNQPAFWRPQFSRPGANVSAAAFGAYLAAAYDAVKGVDPELEVVGIGLSPRGNDKPHAKSNVSTSPVRFLRSLGAWYRRSGRTRPLMDAFSFHPYPNRATDPLDRGYGWPNAGFVNLERVKQALWDAFDDTPQPTTLTGLKLHLDEVGWQVDTSGRAGYFGRENVPVTDELTQASIYAELIQRSACDADVHEVSFFGFRDDGSRTGFQAALNRVDGTPRPAAAAVQEAIAEAAAGCTKQEVLWDPLDDVLGARADVGQASVSGVTARIAAAEDARVLMCVRARGSEGSGWAARATRITALAIGGRCRSSLVLGSRPVTIAVMPPDVARDRVEVVVALQAQANRLRRTLLVEEAVLGP